MKKEDKSKQIEWYDNPNLITSFIIGLIALIIILSQSFAINNNLSTASILSSILNHNSIYLLVCIYFIALKTKIGKKYFDFLNVFLILIHGLTAVTSFLTIFQSFGLSSLLSLGIDLLVFIYLVHTLLRSTRIWKSAGLSKSPFNEITNSGYFNTILILSITLLAVNLVSTTSFDGTILTLMDCLYTVLFIRYVFLYSEFLDSKKISVNNLGNFDEIRETIKDSVNDFVEKNKLDEKYEAVKDKVVDLAEDVKEKAIDIKEDIEDAFKDAKLEEKYEVAKDKVTDFVEEIKEKAVDLQEDIEEKVKEAKLDEKYETVKDKVVDLAEDVKEKAADIKKNVDKKVKEAKLDEKLEEVKEKAVDLAENVKEKAVDLKENIEKKIKDNKKDVSKAKKSSSSSKKEVTGENKKTVKKTDSKKGVK